jgi:hypothetical protein
MDTPLDLYKMGKRMTFSLFFLLVFASLLLLALAAWVQVWFSPDATTRHYWWGPPRYMAKVLTFGAAIALFNVLISMVAITLSSATAPEATVPPPTSTLALVAPAFGFGVVLYSLYHALLARRAERRRASR